MKTKDKVIEILNEIYEKHKINGLESLYLWGSITTDEFNENKSDVDAIGIIRDDATVTEKDFEEDLKNSSIKDFHIRLISERDFRTGIPNEKNIITTVMYPTVLLFDLPNWEHVIGKKFKISDFREVLPTAEDVISERKKRILKDNWANSKNVKDEVIVYYLKELLRLVHLRQMLRGINKPFSLKTISQNANPIEAEIINIFKELKSKDYSPEVFKTYIKKLDDFVQETI